MKTHHAAAIAFLLASGPASAEFKTSEATTWPGSRYECGIVDLVPRERDNDPVYKIEIALGFGDEASGKRLKTMEVTHVTVTGKEYARSDQYGDTVLKPSPVGADAYWRGVWKRNAAVVMTGRLWIDPSDGRIKYVENQTRDGVRQMQTVAVCHEN